ncbi:Spermidine/putrescine import ATP-binding protein PotA [uncultured Avibacterium sp.]|uniref:Spermidine/putrescine import ATP-binding protein PotA n=1 Tax=uncultured Avibacterium sp. TaxID=1936169 RepID=A0A486XG16_9PAST|nr:Spermidine/putrescine import ATP-binding protein PotA [uncultured Avibacterium sp.]
MINCFSLWDVRYIISTCFYTLIVQPIFLGRKPKLVENSVQTKPIIELRSLTKSYGDKTIINGLNLTINNGEFLTILGPSGCGKTTVLRLIAGLEDPNGGKIILDGQDITDVPAERRFVNTVFQSYALFPHMTIFENVAFGLRMQKVPNAEIKPRVMEALRMVRLEEMADRKPNQLSGGQQQRIAIARAVVNKPKVLLLDESLSALDYKLRKEMQNELKALQRQLGITFIFVTHDQEEALTMSDRIIVMNKGNIEQDGTPREIYEEPKNLFVARFIGEINVFNAKVIERVSEKTVKANVEGRICEIYTDLPVQPDQHLKVLLRPEDIVIEELDENEQSKAIIGHVSDRNYKGMTLESSIILDHNNMKVLVSEFFNEDDPHIDHSVGQKVALTWHEGWEVVLDDEDS